MPHPHYVDIERPSKLVKLTCAKSRPYRIGGGFSYYCIAGSNVNIPCSTIDQYIADEMTQIQVDPALIPLIRDSYTEELTRKLGHLRPSEQQELQAALKAVDNEEARTTRLFASSKITEHVWDSLWTEWQDRRHSLQSELGALQQKREHHIANLDMALTIIAKVGILYTKLDFSDQKSCCAR